MNEVSIGIHVQAGLPGLRSTIDALRKNTRVPFDLWLLRDGPDAPALATVEATTGICEISIAETSGTAACFNRFSANTKSEFLLLLENGSIVGPGWLDHLLTALRSDARNGIAGPSTNRCWNAQAIFPAAGESPAEIARNAEAALRRFGIATRTLEPLHSLSDFCYVVRREVIDAIGLADEGFGLGPCWEMDYNIRAARAGWRGVWVCGAYVHRSPPDARRQEIEARLFEAAKRRYQDKFCGARLRGEKHDYRAHCRGDACPNFAPLEFRTRWSGIAPAAPATFSVPASSPSKENAQVPAPRVTCIMPTHNRRPFVSAAIRNFLCQDYPELELLIVDDGTDAVEDLVPPHPRVRYLRLTEKKILGDKRNFACAQARGEFIVHWDDDDWYPADRVRRQMARLSEPGVEICGTSRLYYIDPAAGHSWLYSYATSGRPWVAGNTLAYRRSFWERHPFPRLQIGEDTRFVWANAETKICDLKDPALCVARVHAGNTSRKVVGGACWRTWPVGEIRQLMGQDLAAFCGTASPTPPLPLVSCIMPTANRRNFVRLALRSFQAQDYPHKELIIVDDGREDLSELIGSLPNVSYLKLPAPASIGAKRNLACRAARGDIIAHWDDDDWYAPGRLTHQVGPLLSGRADMTGLENSCLLDLASGQFWRVTPALHRRMFVGDVHGGTLVFRKSIFNEGVHYPDVNLAEDAAVIRAAVRKGNRLIQLPNAGQFVYVRHGRNAWKFVPGRFLDARGWASAESPAAFNPLLAEYQEAIASAP